MKGYLGLGAMLVGAGLMFVLMHGEVRADDKDWSKSDFLCHEQSRALWTPAYRSYKGEDIPAKYDRPYVIGAIFWSVKKETRLVTSYTGMKAEVVYPALKKGCLNKKGTS